MARRTTRSPRGQAHAALVDTFVRLLRGLGWVVEVEVSFSIWGERGSIDILAFHPLFGALLVVEIKSAIADSQATLHGLDRKARLAREVTRARGWDVRHVSRLLVIGATATSRRRVARLAATYDAALPDRGTATRRWLRRPDRPIAGLLFVADDRQDGARKASVARERVRKPRRAQTTATTAAEQDHHRSPEDVVDTARLAVE
jgi:hypothetical protein